MRAFVGFGANLADRVGTIRRAGSRLLESPGVSALRLSALRETEPVGTAAAPAEGASYVNAVGEIETELPPLELLELCLEVEEAFGRVRTVRNAARIIDLDLLLWGDVVVDSESPGRGVLLTLPHPRLLERGFVLEPLAELCPDMRHPVTGKTMQWHWNDFVRTHSDIVGRVIGLAFGSDRVRET